VVGTGWWAPVVVPSSRELGAFILLTPLQSPRHDVPRPRQV
jgi:hypothetical protein